jgi:hypothetical protein
MDSKRASEQYHATQYRQKMGQPPPADMTVAEMATALKAARPQALQLMAQ